MCSPIFEFVFGKPLNQQIYCKITRLFISTQFSQVKILENNELSIPRLLIRKHEIVQ